MGTTLNESSRQSRTASREGFVQSKIVSCGGIGPRIAWIVRIVVLSFFHWDIGCRVMILYPLTEFLGPEQNLANQEIRRTFSMLIEE